MLCCEPATPKGYKRNIQRRGETKGVGSQSTSKRNDWSTAPTKEQQCGIKKQQRKGNRFYDWSRASWCTYSAAGQARLTMKREQQSQSQGNFHHSLLLLLRTPPSLVKKSDNCFSLFSKTSRDMHARLSLIRGSTRIGRQPPETLLTRQSLN